METEKKTKLSSLKIQIYHFKNKLKAVFCLKTVQEFLSRKINSGIWWTDLDFMSKDQLHVRVSPF